MLASLRIAVAVMMAAEPATSEREVPPPGIRVADETRKELEAGAQSLAREIDLLRVALEAKVKTVRIGKKSFDSIHHLPVLIYPNPLHPKQYVVLNSGFTCAHSRSSSNADQTPKLADYAVVDIEGPASVGVAGEVVEAGFFDEHWRVPGEGEARL